MAERVHMRGTEKERVCERMRNRDEKNSHQEFQTIDAELEQIIQGELCEQHDKLQEKCQHKFNVTIECDR